MLSCAGLARGVGALDEAKGNFGLWRAIRHLVGAKDEGGQPLPEREVVGGDLKYLQRLTSLTIDETGSAPTPTACLGRALSAHVSHSISPSPWVERWGQARIFYSRTLGSAENGKVGLLQPDYCLTLLSGLFSLQSLPLTSHSKAGFLGKNMKAVGRSLHLAEQKITFTWEKTRALCTEQSPLWKEVGQSAKTLSTSKKTKNMMKESVALHKGWGELSG